MSVLTLPPRIEDVPVTLPVDHLSASSIAKFMQCPEKWRRRYIDRVPEPASGNMICGSAAGAALAQHYGRQIEDGHGLSLDDLLDEFSTEWEDRVGREEILWGAETPGELKDSGAGALAAYHRRIAAGVVPVTVEREFELGWPEVEWTVCGFIDLEDAAGWVRDYKLVSRRMSPKDADADLQATLYLAARRAERNPAAGFCFDTMVRNRTPVAETVKTHRDCRELDALSIRIFDIAREIAWRCRTGVWSGAAPRTWFCGTCRYRDCQLRLGRPSW